MPKNSLTEYEEGSEWARHYHKITWTVATLFLPLSFGLLGVSYTIEHIQQNFWAQVILAGSSISLHGIWLAIDKRYSFYLQIIFSRLQELERHHDMDLHNRIHSRDQEIPFRRLKRVRNWVWVIFVTLWVLWVLRIGSLVLSL